MRILIVTGLSHWGRGGVQRETVQLVSSLISSGVATGFVVDRPLGLDRLEEFVVGPADRLRDIVSSAIDAFRPDVVHMIGGGAKTILATGRACGDAGIPWVMTVHNLPPHERAGRLFPGRNSLYYATRNAASVPTILAWRYLLARSGSSKIIVHSSFVHSLLSHAGCSSDVLALIPLGTDEDAPAAADEEPAYLAPPGARPHIVTIAAFAHTKGIHDYLDVVARLVALYPDIHLTWIGAERFGPYDQFIRAELKRLDLEGRVTIIKNASDAVRLEALRTADLYAQPSHEEGFCLTYLEAARLVPRMLGTRTGAMAEMSESDEMMRVVPPGDREGLLRETVRLLDAAVAEKSALLAERVRRLEQAFSWMGHTRTHIDLYASLAYESPTTLR
jgi:glycosyltransferase involved in cell wall biosynthesis